MYPKTLNLQPRGGGGGPELGQSGVPPSAPLLTRNRPDMCSRTNSWQHTKTPTNKYEATSQSLYLASSELHTQSFCPASSLLHTQLSAQL